MINLLHGQETLDCQESKRSSGRHPNWNQSFVFHVDLDRLTLSDSNNNLDCESVSAKVENLQYLSDVLIELIVMRANRNRIEATVGCVRIGQKSVLAAKQHWLEACVTHQDDYVFRWHELQPLDRL